jgi:hypothetical protein
MKTTTLLCWSGLIVALSLGAPENAVAHCDALDGPVVKAAQRALEASDPSPALIWVQPNDEPEVRRAFEQTLAVRALGPAAEALADRFFFETLVRLHRAGEGAPFTGLKPAGGDVGPAIAAADKALDEGTVAGVEKLLDSAIQQGLRDQFQTVLAAKRFNPPDLAAGRKYVKAYVEFIHYVERLHEAAIMPAPGHFEEPPPRGGDRR